MTEEDFEVLPPLDYLCPHCGIDIWNGDAFVCTTKKDNSLTWEHYDCYRLQMLRHS